MTAAAALDNSLLPRRVSFESAAIQTEKAATARKSRSDTVIPACALRAAIEPLPEGLAQDAIVKEDCFGIVGFVGKRDKQGLRGLRWQLSEIRFLPRSPFQLRLGPCVGAIGNNFGYGIAEFSS